jgi:hypothetical protein
MNRKNKIAVTLLAATLAAAAVLSCARRPAREHDPVLQAYRLIDEQRTDEAIELLEGKLAEDPDNADYKVVLASAYAHKGGIKIQKLVPLINQAGKLKTKKKPNPAKSAKPATSGKNSTQDAREVPNLLETQESDEAEEFQEAGETAQERTEKTKTPPTLSQRANTGANQIAAMLVRFAGFFRVYAAVPVITAEQSTYIRHAIYLLNGVGDLLRPGDALYRAILEVVLLKHILAEKLLGEFVDGRRDADGQCRLNIGDVNDALIEMGKLLIDIYNDLGYANPKQAKGMRAKADATAETVSHLTTFFTSAAVLDEASNLFLKQTAIQNGFGKLIRCSAN